MVDLLEKIRALLTATPLGWRSVSRILPVDLLVRRPAPAEWSVVECLQHLIDSEKIFQFRVKCFLEDLDFPAFDPDTQGTQVNDQHYFELANEFETLRLQSLRLLEFLSVADLERCVRHQALGPVTLQEMLAEWAAHDLDHTIQAERALIQPLLIECGPWIGYYKEHIVQERS